MAAVRAERRGQAPVTPPDARGVPRPADHHATYRRSAKVFLALFGLVHLAAFASLYVQLDELIGSGGLLPAAETVRAVQERGEAVAWHEFPTIFRWNASDGALRTGAVAGILLSLLVTVGVLRKTCLLLLGVLYLSFITVGQTFFYFQWDNLLMESTLHALLLPAYSRVLLRRGAERVAFRRLVVPHAVVVFLMQWLLFRVYFESGIAKVQAAGGGWREMWAMSFYYDTAPLATWLGWYAHNLPAVWHRWETGLTLVIECVLPLMIFAGRRARQVLFVVLSGFQIAILLTANYGIFNYLTLILGLFLLEDRDYAWIVGAWERVRGRLWRRATAEAAAVRPRGLIMRAARTTMLSVIAALIVGASLVEFGLLVIRDAPTRAALSEWRVWRDFRVVNSYHLFAGMTQERDVVEVQGLAADGRWVPYRWRWAPGEAREAPRIVAPHHPRIDFQVWFLTLGNRNLMREAWFARLLERLTNEPASAARFFREDPFAGDRPRAIRAVSNRYRMSDAATRAADGAWWVIEPRGRLTRDLAVRAAPSAGSQPAR